MRCFHCDGEIPENGRFCIECGKPVPETKAATGATQRLPEYANGIYCQSCGTHNPPGAQFCVMCGHAVTEEVARRFFQKPELPAPPRPLMEIQTPPPPMAMPRRPMAWYGISGGMFLIGLAVLGATGWWWPGILVLIGIMTLVNTLSRGQLWMALQSSLWMFGLAILGGTGWWWPGILVLVGISTITGALFASMRRNA